MRERTCNLTNSRLQLAAPVAAGGGHDVCLVHARSRPPMVGEPGYNAVATTKCFLRFLLLLALCLSNAVFAAQTQDAEYEAVAEEYVKTYLAAHPLQGTALGLHE